jgi:hypothetical protein
MGHEPVNNPESSPRETIMDHYKFTTRTDVLKNKNSNFVMHFWANYQNLCSFLFDVLILDREVPNCCLSKVGPVEGLL